MSTVERKPMPKRTIVGPAVFVVTLAAVLVFFWWFLIYDHGAAVAQ